MCEQDKKKTIQPKHINLGMRTDEELAKMITMTTIHEGGQLYHVNDALLAKKGKGKGSHSASQAV